MGLKSTTRDPRTFRHFARMAADGTVAAVIALADGSLTAEAFDRGEDIDEAKNVYVDVTDLYPHDLRTARVKTVDVARKDRAAIAADLKTQNTGLGKDRGG